MSIGTIEMLKSNKSAFVNTEDEKFFIHGKNLHGALNGDLVEVKETKAREGKKSSEGKVERIIERANKDIVGVLKESNDFGFVIPSIALGTDIFVSKRNFNGAKNGDLVSVKITKYPKGKNKTEGTIIKVIGDSEDVDNVVEGLKIANDIVSEFPKDVMDETHKVVAMGVDYSNREDYTGKLFITIDGSDAKDLDDAVLVERAEDGYKLSVAIADVSHYIKTGSALDKEALKRGNSTYMVGEVVPMLPKEISNGICSLNPDTEKMVSVCEMIIGYDGEIVSYEFKKAVIKTAHRMTYARVNDLYANGYSSVENKKYIDIRQMLERAFNLAQLIRTARYQRGSLALDMPEPKIILDEKGKVEDIVLRDRGESERIIEDFMVIANECTAREIAKKQGESKRGIYRIHELPNEDSYRRLHYFLGEFGYTSELQSTITPKLYQGITESVQGTYEATFLQKMVLMSLKQAKYSTENLGHFGLASDGYSHFTSPIRRYADLLAHRLIFGEKINEDELVEMCKTISKTERTSAEMESRSIKIKCAEYMLDKIGQEFDATIVGISKHTIFVMLDNHVEAEFPMPTGYEFDEKKYVAINSSGSVFNIGGSLVMKVSHVSMADFRVMMKF